MDDLKFWALVETAKSMARTADDRPDLLMVELTTLSLVEIQAFQAQYENMLLKANTWDLWGAAYLMNGGCSDDGFKYFRDWLISEGKSAFDAALANPDSLADCPKQDYFDLESFGYAALQAFESKGGGELERSFEVELAQPAGDQWDEEQLPAKFPRLAAKYLNG